MKSIHRLIPALIPLLVAFSVRAQAPASIRGDALFLTITGGSGSSFPNAGYTLVFVGNAANSYTRLELTEGTAGSGSFTYAQSGADALLAVTDSGVGAFDADYTYTDAQDGTFAFSKLATTSTENGRFADYYGTAPASLVGSTISSTITDGSTNDSSSGTWSLTFNSVNGLTITDTDGVQHTATYTVSAVNRSTAKIVATQTGGKVTTVYFSFVDPIEGGFGMHNNHGGWEIGTFTFQAAPDITRPTLTIITPLVNAHLSNQVATVSGTAHDNASVANVFVSADGVTWVGASTANFNTNWTASVGLNPGANTILAYAVDGSGNISLTNQVNVTYIVSAPLAVSINGNGTVSPNYNNATLQINSTYTMTATVAAGFAFINWTDGHGNVVTNTAALKFSMASNLVFVANFADVTKPVVTITSPATGQRSSNFDFTVTGKASDNVSVSAVYYNFNNGGWIQANPGNVPVGSLRPVTRAVSNIWSNWTASVDLTPGTNTVSAYAVDGSGNISRTNTVNWIYVLSARLTVTTNGKGSILPNYNNAFLQISNRYTMTAAPAPGFQFTGWSDGNGDLVTNRPALSFVMASNLVFTANFADTNRPVLTVTTPLATTVATNEFYPASGKAKDNAAVASVMYQVNNGGWFPANSTNGWTNWSVTIDLAPGTNLFAAYAVDTSGNISPTNTTKFIYATAPASLSGQIAAVSPNIVNLAFGAGKFSLFSDYTNSGNAVGTYTYVKQTPTVGLLKLNYTAPPSLANVGVQTNFLTFSAPNMAQYDNNGFISSFNFTSTPTLVSPSLLNQNLVIVGSSGEADTIHLGAGKFYSTNLLTLRTNIGNYLYAPSGPVGALLSHADTNGPSFTVVTFSTTNSGTYYTENYDPSGFSAGSDVGVFGLASQHAGGNAPTNIVGRSTVITTDSSSDQINFLDGSNFADVNPTNSTLINGTGTYLYTRTGTNSASLDLNFAAESPAALSFKFVAPNFAVFTNGDSTIGTAVWK